MSAELKAKFTADASDFNGAVRQIEGKLKGVGKIGQGLGLGRVGNGVGDFLQGIGGLGLRGGGVGAIALGGMAAFRNISESLDERAKALEAGMPVHELTSFGEAMVRVRENLGVMGRAFSGFGKLVTEGLQSYQEYVLNDPKAAAQQFADAQEAAANKIRELEKTVAYEIKTSDAMAKARERIASQRRGDANASNERVGDVTRALDDFIGGYGRQNQITAAEKAGDSFAAELMRITDQINGIVGRQMYSTTDVAQILGPQIQERLAMNAPRLSETLQTSPELSDRLRRIGGGGTGYDQTTQVFKDSLSVERQQLGALNAIKEKLSGNATLTTL